MKCEYCGRHGYAECCAGCSAPLPFVPQKSSRDILLEMELQKKIMEQKLAMMNSTINPASPYYQNPNPANPYHFHRSGTTGKNYR